MTMSSVVVVVPPELEAGFRLAGVATAAAATAADAVAAVDRMARELSLIHI